MHGISNVMTATAPMRRSPEVHSDAPTENSVARCVNSTGVNLARAHEMLDTIIGSVACEPSCSEKSGKSVTNGLMDAALSANDSAQLLCEKLDRLASLLGR